MNSLSSSIKFSDLSIDRGTHQIIKSISADLTEPRIGIIGRNGSGKSSLIRSFNGLLPIASGSLQIHGVDAKTQSPELSRTAGFVFQNPDHQLIFPTPQEEISFGLRQLGVDKKLAKQQAIAYLRDNGWQRLAESPVHELSEGQKQYLCILAVLVMEPKLLILDEPFSSLDFRTCEQLRRRLHQLPQQIVFVSHVFKVLEDYDRILWLEEGTIKMDGPPQQVLDSYLAHEQESLFDVSLLEDTSSR
ncbi:energy-coupling factor ABC transporter ATP-binding protein [Flexibacterium corallicola]|uniref:energy-coupling factor ABC transporter ATP-binding protein n=1 Tax=Flexibacterium corallicola TaxID=3037259 RepID=UPI00286F3791|nr:ABC transporter ATP-binding protein [Pseudovibrio sp. M1P-2-3]